jgi:hypothetical protein
MHCSVARDIAREAHRDQQTRFGDPVVEHLERVAAAVPEDARATAWLHDLFEKSDRSRHELRARGLTGEELDALELLTRRPSEPYMRYAERIAEARGVSGRLARLVKLADLDDHLAHRPAPPGAPPYGRAHRRISRAHARGGDREQS